MMKDWNLKQGSYPTQFAILIGITGACFMLAALSAQVVWGMMVGNDIPLDPNAMLKPEYYNVNMVLQGVSTFIIFLLPAVTVATICYKNANDFLGLNTRFNSKQILTVLAILLSTFYFAGAVAELNRLIPLPAEWEKKFKAYEQTRQAQEAAFLNINSTYKFFLSLLIMAVLPAIFEEIYFRAGLQNILTRWFGKPWVAIIITSVIFSLIHLSYYGFLVRFSLGIILGLIFYYSKNVWLPILFHFLFNGIQVLLVYIFTIKGIKRSTELERNLPFWLGIIAFGALLYLFMYFRKTSNSELVKYGDQHYPAHQNKVN